MECQQNEDIHFTLVTVNITKIHAQNYLICYTYSYTSIYFIGGIEIYRILTGNKMREHKTQESHEHV